MAEIEDYDVFDILAGKFVGQDTIEHFTEDIQIVQAEFEIVKAILEHHLHPDKTESVD